MSTEPIREGREVPYQADSYESQTPHSRFEQDLQPSDRTNTNLFPETDFDLNYDYFNSSDSLFHPDYSPMPDILPAFETFEDDPFVSTSSESPGLAGSSLSSSSRSETSKIPHTTTYSNTSGNASLAPSDTLGRDNESARIAISKSSALRCAECSQVFACTSRLERHSKSHARFACAKGCAETFALDKDRRRHESTIHGNSKLQCEVCGRKCRKDNLRRHMKIHERLRNQNAIRVSEHDT